MKCNGPHDLNKKNEICQNISFLIFFSLETVIATAPRGNS